MSLSIIIIIIIIMNKHFLIINVNVRIRWCNWYIDDIDYVILPSLQLKSLPTVKVERCEYDRILILTFTFFVYFIFY